MFNSNHLKNHFSKAAAQYDAHAELQQLILADAVALAAPHWPENAPLLDMGCGTGAFHSLASHQQLNIEIIGLDIAFGMCQFAHKTNPQTLAADAVALPFADAAFSGCLSSLMMQWAPDPLAIFREMARVTKAGGVCVITSFTHGTLHELQQSFAAIDTHPHVNHFPKPMELSTLAVHAGLALLHAEEETFTEYYNTATDLMRSIKAIGASNKLAGGKRGLMTANRLKKIEKHYKDQFGHKKNGLPATWNATTLLLEKRP